jgi:hypothetical protein
MADGMPAAQLDPAWAETVIVNGKRRWFLDEVTDFLFGARATEGETFNA